MRSILNTICILLLVIFIDQSILLAQINNSGLYDSNYKIPNKNGIGTDDIANDRQEKPTPGKILAIIENIRDIGLQQISDSATLIKNYSEKIGNNRMEINFYFKQNQIMTIVYRIYNTEGKRIFHKVYYFDNNGSCNLYSLLENIKIGERTFVHWMGFLLVTDSYYDSKVVEGDEKRKIIETAKSSLDSIMQHFPDFRYSLNWK